MRVIVKKWGNSASVRIPAAVMQAAKLSLDTPVDIREENGRIIIEPDQSPEFFLDDLLESITRENCHDAIETGGPLGQEAL
ncbi:AbrB/MazE/SpoVT family DNA-binding domain-containing protein [Sulfitobacter sp. F26204]|uniref:AbrB/MazE/SpoVT family DNA-binding domain-containing protein n=1 Tax=Sulfitobacter sp. F26204 TaxID=2996014 RepID=UPI00225DE171|nr:AbrB/MazE/SpoVT family DNA-binding domain-containing protein [Sulfitobacter sp. F26204]MCX7561261.1 AbrB/MazE/SpoVT family DNA-binding domain-containing protein [Sulfitobacter sp. F26204]